MVQHFSLDDPREMEIWDSFVLSQSESLPFHLSNWLRTIRDAYRYQPLLYVDLDDSLHVRAIAPFFLVKRPFGSMRLVCLPFSDYCAPLSSDVSSSKALIDKLLSREELDHLNVEIREAVDDRFITQSPFCHQVLRLTSNPEDLKKSIDKRTIQYSIRKAERSGVSIVQENTRKGIEEFRRLNLLTRKKHGLPPQPVAFFDCFYTYMVVAGKADILLALSENSAIAAGVFIRHNSTVHYKYSATDARFTAQKTPNHLLTWAAIEKSCREGFSFFDFGRTELTNEGLVRYKEMWGATSSILSYSYYPAIKGIAGNWEKKLPYRVLTSIMKKMPNRLLQRLGDSLYKFSG